jgi:transcription-repair coupling factor (superfamily II helicase)
LEVIKKLISITNPLQKLDTFNTLVSSIQKGSTPILTSGVSESQKNHLSYSLTSALNCPTVIVTHSQVSAKEIYQDIQFFMGDNVKYYPSKDISFYNADFKSLEITKQRLDVLELLSCEKPCVIVLCIEALLDKLTPKDIFLKNILELKVLDTINLDELIQKLIFMGYERRDLVEIPGQFAIRGGILDIFITKNSSAIRIEFFGDEVDSIRILDPLSQRSTDTVDCIKITPVKEVIYSQKIIDIGISNITIEFNKTYSKYIKFGLLAEAENLKNNISKILDSLKESPNFSKLDNYTHFFYEDAASLLDYLPKNSLLIFDEPKRLNENVTFKLRELNESITNRIEKGELLPSTPNMVFSYTQILSMCKPFSTVLFSNLTYSIKDFTVKDIVSFNIKSLMPFKDDISLMLDDLNYWVKNEYCIFILGGSKIRCQNIEEQIRQHNIPVSYTSNLSDAVQKKGAITIIKGNLKKGFEYPSLKFVLLTYSDLSNENKSKKNKKNKKASIESFTDLKIGDYIVHDNHGIGIYKGIEKIIQNNIYRDYLKLQYSDGGNIFVSTSQMDFIQKYIGGESSKLKLSKLSTGEWNKAKAKAKASVKLMAKDLIVLYAKRENAKGFEFSKDTVWQSEFEEMFPYSETDDQLNAIADVKLDMESSKVMDRLICGDVGYGKTEVAIRSAFKAVQDGKQVAYLVPTTILAQQHYNHFVERMKDFPIGVELLSRFKTPKQQKETFLKLENGSCDIVIGTHKLLSKHLKFKDLGLIIVDEEQRFGVAHKDKLKKIKEDIDVLTLSATPIPRTLHMSLTGIRDISLLEEPPLERHPIQTYVMEHNTSFVKEAINRELARNGQVYYVSNRVRSIEDTTIKLQALVPDAKVAYAHGQMSERELEAIMVDFIEGTINVLVCTTIIETGLDISNVNTIIIQDADYMGLSQLYQLRGRVGRSNRLAYAYLTYRPQKVLTEVAEKRLQTIREFTEFGSGFKIAMRDLEIRGVGNLLGADQHGHMDSVGYDMYCKLLLDAVKEEQGEVVLQAFETSIDININAYIPDKYITSEEQKLEIYKKIAHISNKEDYFKIQEEIEDRYGNLPIFVQNLLEIALLKAYGNTLYITSIKQTEKNILFIFRRDACLNIDNLTKVLNKNLNKVNFISSTDPKLIYNINDKFKLKDLHKILQDIIG